MGESERRIGAWIALGGWTAVILVLGGESFSGHNTAGWFRDVLLWLVPSLGDGAIRAIHLLARKGAHVAVYAVLAVCAFRAFTSERRVHERVALLALAWVVVVAVVDETRQARAATRTGTTTDVVLDTGGGAAGLGALLWWQARRRAAEGRDA